MRASGHLVLRNGFVVDGTGEPAVKADLLVEGARVGAVGFPETGSDAEEIDVSGLVVAPGFIDIHSHSDFTLLRDPRAVSQISQGVTTEVIGNCGYGCCPICDPKFAREAIYGYDSSIDMDWTDLDGYFRRLEAAGPAVNVASLVPNGQLRIGVLGGASRAAAPDEIRRMASLLQENLEQGAFGFSTGLEYPWESSASVEEITALCKIVARHGGIYATHTRDRDAHALAAIDEALDTARAAEVALQISHIVPRRGRDDAERAIARVDQALARGQDVAFDMHTRLFGTTFLKVLLPAFELRLPRDVLARRLADAAVMKEMLGYRSLISSVGDWSLVELFKAPARPELERMTFDEIGRRMGCDPHHAAIAVLLAHADDLNGPMVLLHTYDEETLRLAYRHGSCTVGSDATALAPDGLLSDSQFHGAYSWASWFYRRMVRETATFTMEAAIHRLTDQPARRVGIVGRGLLKPGFAADIAVFDPQVFGETATTYDANRLAVGMRHVLVNGRLALRDGIETGDRNGRILRKNGR